MNVKKICLTSMVAAAYMALGFIFQSIAFGAIQIRIADALYPLISLGSSFLLGTFLGHLIFNTYGFTTGIALGIGDLASPFIFLIPKLLIWKFGKSKKGLMATTLLHVTAVTLWVSYLLQSMFGVPQVITAPTIFAGEAIAEGAIGIPLTLAIKKRNILR